MPRLSLLERTALGAFASYARGRLRSRLAALTLFGSRARGEAAATLVGAADGG